MTPTIRCSSLPHLLACNGSRTVIARIKEVETAREVAWEGTWGHYRIATRLVDEQAAEGPDGGIHLTIPDTYKPSPFARWMADFCYNTVVESVDTSWGLMVEQEFLAEFSRFNLTGHPDCIAVKVENVDGKPCVVEAIGWDFKFGAIAVDPAAENEQVMGYVVLMADAWPHLRKVTFRIVQPRNDEEERVSEVVVDGELNLAHAYDYLNVSVCRALERTDDLNTGKQCRYCPAALQCPALKAEIEELMNMKLTKEQIEAIEPEPPMATLVQLYDSRRLLAPVFDAADTAFKARVADAGGVVALPDGRTATITTLGGKRRITDVAMGLVILGELPDALRLTCIELPPPRIEEALAAHNTAQGGKRTAGRKLYDAKFCAITEQGVTQVLTVK